MRFLQQTQYNMSIANSRFNGNTAARYGGAIATMVGEYNCRCAMAKNEIEFEYIYNRSEYTVGIRALFETIQESMLSS